MKLTLMLALLFTAACAHKGKPPVSVVAQDLKKVIKTVKGLSTPESAYYDPKTKLVFVSNIEGGPMDKDKKGWISILNKKGKVLNRQWVKGLNAPKGLRSDGDSLWVTDIDQVIRISIKKGTVQERYPIPGSEFLNDLAIDDSGNVYVSDMFTGNVYRIVGGKIETYITSDDLRAQPNGLYFHNGHLYVAAWGTDLNKKDFSTKKLGGLLKVDLGTKEVMEITGPLGNLDGLELTRDNTWLTSDWKAGKVFRITNDGSVSLLYSGNQGTADIGYIPGKKGKVLVPMMKDGTTLFLNL